MESSVALVERAQNSAEDGPAELRPPEKFDHTAIWQAIAEVHRVACGTARDVGDLVKVVGSPARGEGEPSTGIFHELGKLDKRLKPLETIRERIIGAGLVLGGCGVVLWWLEGAKIAAIFHR
jgi:hypothetical protein